MTMTAKRLHQQQHDYVLLQSTQRCQQEPYFSAEGALHFNAALHPDTGQR